MIRKKIAALFALSNITPVLTIILGTLAGFGLTDRWLPRDTVLLTLVTLIAAQLLIDRLGILTSIYEKTLPYKTKHMVELLPRTDPQYQHFHDFVQGSTEVMVVGIDMGFLAKTDAYFVKEAIRSGLTLKILMTDPQLHRKLKDTLNLHDERNERENLVHDHIGTAKTTIDTLRRFVEPGMSGRIEIRARCDIPSPSLTLVDPTKPQGKIRVELKPYKRNHGEVPSFVLDRESAWYNTFYELYFNRLWKDSPVIFDSVNDLTSDRLLGTSPLNQQEGDS